LTQSALNAAIVIAYLVATYFIAWADLQVQGLILVAAIYGILAVCLDATAGILGLYSLGVGGFFAIGAYLTTILSTIHGVNVFLLIPIVVGATGLLGVILGAASLRVSGLHFAITTFIFTLVITVLATDLQITNGLQGLLGRNFPDFAGSSRAARTADRLVRDADSAGGRSWRREAGVGASGPDFALGREAAGVSRGFADRGSRRRR
jgi:ABC-type branched-subunit amino acid transport system permease subunit